MVMWLILYDEYLATLPDPWGYFQYGWWKLGYSGILDIVFLIILVRFSKWMCRVGDKMHLSNGLLNGGNKLLP
ncbi:hypothetical protein AN964_16570 [Heyndrickxia shackletonii]|uniref:Uncharacterized protein n=1 Tax=Heyndrickxia shackletonii TaxID=157838 RepID=A0A0Q3WZQ0_9BACI|nr:hypothetical protein [Heyndrickxia shackletonii]KQL54955.1 hypothetical protein AN964_16570 [Heyndrickxia shackletonii]